MWHVLQISPCLFSHLKSLKSWFGQIPNKEPDTLQKYYLDTWTDSSVHSKSKVHGIIYQELIKRNFPGLQQHKGNKTEE